MLRGSVSRAQAQGPREAQEDSILYIPFRNAGGGRCHLLGVMDGHGGKGIDGGEVSRYCKEQIPNLINPKAAHMGKEFMRLVEELDARTSLAEMGSTLSLAWIDESEQSVTTAVLGDSPVIVVDASGKVRLSEMHNVRNTFELEAALRRGAIFHDGYLVKVPEGDGLQLTRSLGDNYFRRILNQTPVISRYVLGEKSLVMIGSDGLFDIQYDALDTDVVQATVAEAQKKRSARGVLRWSKKQGLLDNTSLILWRAGGLWNPFF